MRSTLSFILPLVALASFVLAAPPGEPSHSLNRDNDRYDLSDPPLRRRKIVGSVVLKPDNSILFVTSKQGQLILPKGGWSHGEDIEQAVLREVREEAGVVGELEKKKPLGTWVNDEQHVTIYQVKYVGENQAKSKEDQGKTNTWVTIDEVQNGKYTLKDPSGYTLEALSRIETLPKIREDVLSAYRKVFGVGTSIWREQK